MKVYFIGAGPGDPELLTIKGKKILEKAGYCLYAGSLVNKDILSKYTRPGTKRYDTHGMALEEQLKIVKEAQESGEDVARLHTGDPSIYGAIQEQMRALDAMGIDYEVIPGVSSFVAAAASLKQELTLPGVSQTVIITRVEGQTPVPAKESLKVLAQSKPTLCIFLSISHIERIVGELLPSYGPDCPAVVVYKSTWEEEKIVRTSLSRLAEDAKREGITKTALIIVGEVLSKDFERSQVYQSR
ncbi:MAG: precorrin-4 C(11)-methyltransferase [Candidatus Brocadiales bacterium]